MNDKLVLQTVNEVWRDQTSLLFLQQVCQNLPENLQLPAGRTLQHFVDSLKINRLDIKLQGGAIALVYNMYASGQLITDDNI